MERPAVPADVQRRALEQPSKLRQGEFAEVDHPVALRWRQPPTGDVDDAAARVIQHTRERLPAANRESVLSIGECSLAELRALLDRAALFIGGDSGPLHIAATSAIPIVGLYGPTLPVRSAPWRSPMLTTESVEGGPLECRPCDQRVCAPGDFRCLTRISADMVFEASHRALARANRV